MEKAQLENKEERQILVFQLANQELGLDVSCVYQVMRPQDVYPLPKMPDFIEGLIDLRGHIVPLIDLRKRLHVQPFDAESHKRVIICKVHQTILGLTVNSLKEMITLPNEKIQPIPGVVADQMEADILSGIAKVGKRMIALLDLEQLITQKEISELSSLGK